MNIGPPPGIINSKKIGKKKKKNQSRKRGTVFDFDANPISQKRGLASAVTEKEEGGEKRGGWQQQPDVNQEE